MLIVNSRSITQTAELLYTPRHMSLEEQMLSLTTTTPLLLVLHMAGFYKHLKTMNLEGKRDRSSAYVKDENGVLLRDVDLIRER